MTPNADKGGHPLSADAVAVLDYLENYEALDVLVLQGNLGWGWQRLATALYELAEYGNDDTLPGSESRFFGSQGDDPHGVDPPPNDGTES